MQTSTSRPDGQLLAVLCSAMALLLCCGCATERPERWKNVAVFDLPYDRVWREVVEFNQAVAPESVVDALSGTVQSPQQRVNLEEFPFEQYAEEPGVYHTWANRRFNTRYHVRKLSQDKTEVTVAAQFSAYSTDAERWLVWRSNGKYEEFLVSRLRESLQKGSTSAE